MIEPKEALGIIDTDRWELREEKTGDRTLYKLGRKVKFREGLFAALTMTLDFAYKSDAEHALDLFESLELLLEEKLLEAIKDSVAIREEYFGKNAYAKKEYDKTSPAARGLKG